MLDTATAAVVLIGYTTVAVYALTLAHRFSRLPIARLRALIIAAPAIGWVTFYLWTSTLTIPLDHTAVNAARTASRLLHLPTIAALYVLLRILHIDATRTVPQ